MPNSITCPICGKTSYNPNDIANKYCGNCHYFWGDIKAHVHGTVTSDNVHAFKAVIEAAHQKISEAQSPTCACPHSDPYFCYQVRYQDYVNELNESCDCPCHDGHDEDIDYVEREALRQP